MADQQAIPSLKQVYKDEFPIGAAVSPETLKSGKELLSKHFQSLTAENDMKFGPISPKRQSYDFRRADEIVDFAQQHNMLVRGHTLVWHNQAPDWFFTNPDGSQVDASQLLAGMERHIKTIMGRYRGQIYAWDVVNEAVSDHGDERLRPSKWLEIAGEKFIAEAFHCAHKADPEALLFYNDYNATMPYKRDKIYSLVKELKDQGVPVGGIGLQGHWQLPSLNLEHIREAIELYASLGVKLHVTELDLSFYGFQEKDVRYSEPPAELLEQQKQGYGELFALFREYKDVVTNVTFWGVADDYTWLDNFPVKARKNWPFLFDVNHEPKPAFWSVADWRPSR